MLVSCGFWTLVASSVPCWNCDELVTTTVELALYSSVSRSPRTCHSTLPSLLPRQRQVDRHRDLVLHGLVVGIEGDRPHVHVANRSAEHRVAARRILLHVEMAAFVDLALHGERQRLLQAVLARAVGRCADADGVHVLGQADVLAGEVIAAAGERKTSSVVTPAHGSTLPVR